MPGQFGIFTKLLPWLTDGQQVSPQVDQRGRLIVSSGDNNAAGVLTVAQTELDTEGGIVPAYKAHSYTYDASGNLLTDSVTDGTDTWVRTYSTAPTGVTADSGWVKQ